MTNFRPSDRLTSYLPLPSVDEWLPAGNWPVSVVEAAIENLDPTTMIKSYRGTGSVSYHPAPLLGLLASAVTRRRVFSSRKLERATYDPGGVPLPSRRTIIPITTRSPSFGGGSSRRSRRCSSKHDKGA